MFKAISLVFDKLDYANKHRVPNAFNGLTSTQQWIFILTLIMAISGVVCLCILLNNYIQWTQTPEYKAKQDEKTRIAQAKQHAYMLKHTVEYTKILNNGIQTTHHEPGSVFQAYVGQKVAGDLGMLVGAGLGRDYDTFESYTDFEVHYLDKHTAIQRVFHNTPKYQEYIKKLRTATFMPSADDYFHELRRYKQLLDEGVITQEEFDQIKNRMFNG